MRKAATSPDRVSLSFLPAAVIVRLTRDATGLSIHNLRPQKHPMKKLLLLICAGLLCPAFLLAADPLPQPGTMSRRPGEYPLTADSLPQPGVPKGKLEGPFEFHAKAIPGTVRRYWVYVPAQYTGT